MKKLERAGYIVYITSNYELDAVSVKAIAKGAHSVAAFSGWRGSLLEALTDLAGELGVRL